MISLSTTTEKSLGKELQLGFKGELTMSENMEPQLDLAVHQNMKTTYILPSWKRTYPLKKGTFEDYSPFSQGGIC